LANTKRLGRYHNAYSNANNNDSSSESYFDELASFYREKSRKPPFDWNKPLFGNKSSSLQKLLAKANKTTERATKFLNKIKSRQLACAVRAKSIPKNATIRKDTSNAERRFVIKNLGLITMLTGKTMKAKS
jgi:hypothetical protein